MSLKSIFSNLCIYSFSIFSGFRYYVGVDYVNYVKIYNLEEGYGSRELGFNLILDFCDTSGLAINSCFYNGCCHANTGI